MTDGPISSGSPSDRNEGHEEEAPKPGIPHSALPDGLVVDFRTVPVDPDEWLPGLRGLVLKGEFTVLAADGGAGKSTTVAGWIAELSHADVKVLYLAERSLKGTRKKLEAARADFDNVMTFDLRLFTDIRRGVDHVRAAMVEKDVGLLVAWSGEPFPTPGGGRAQGFVTESSDAESPRPVGRKRTDNPRAPPSEQER